jgi:hypothetical protein
MQERFISIENNIECAAPMASSSRLLFIQSTFRLFQELLLVVSHFCDSRFCWFCVVSYKVINCTMSFSGWLERECDALDLSGSFGIFNSKKTALTENAITLFLAVFPTDGSYLLCFLPSLSLSLSLSLSTAKRKYKYKFYYFREMDVLRREMMGMIYFYSNSPHIPTPLLPTEMMQKYRIHCAEKCEHRKTSGFS